MAKADASVEELVGMVYQQTPAIRGEMAVLTGLAIGLTIDDDRKEEGVGIALSGNRA